MSDQSEADLTEIEARANAATEGPWYWRNSDINVYLLGARSRAVMAFKRMGMQGAQPEFRDNDGLLHGVQKRNIHDFADADFIAHARTDVQVLLAEVRRLRAERDGDGDVDSGTLWRTQRELDHARNERLRLKGTLRCIEALHHPVDVEPSETICAACSQPRPETDGPYYVEEWPCATIQIINGGDHA